ncbi:MAG: M67 family metallopeptidase [Bacteroidetes bacterium]|nr:M67 family metallopeptidase [Bacteroidota bacterium]
MMIIEDRSKDLMIEDAVKTFPDECCGFMFGVEDEEENRIIKDILVVNNSKEGDKTRRFVISPLDYLKGEQYATDHNLLLLGIYHSHPKHPAIPSETDRLSAQPFFSYLIISVLENKSITLRSWRLNESEQFEEEKITDYQLTLKAKQ